MTIDFNKYISDARYLNIDEFQKQFDILWDNLKYSFKKFECLQYYDESEQCPMFDLKRGDLKTFSEKLNKMKESEKSFYIDTLKKGVQLERLHLIEFPINEYLEYEYYTYYITSSLGENIYFKKRNEIVDKSIKDFIIFDSQNVLIHDYDKTGKLRGAWQLSGQQKEYISYLEKWYDSLILEACQFRKMLLPNEKILEMIL